MSEEVKLPKIKLKKEKQKKKKFVIQTIEDYQVENRLAPAKTDITGYPDLFTIRLEKNKRDDVYTKVSILKGTPGVQLYISLLTAHAAAESKRVKEEKLKEEEKEQNLEVENIND